MATVTETLAKILPLITELYPVISKGRVVASNLKIKSEYISALVGVTSNESELREKALKDEYADYSGIDPFNRLEIFERIIWPTMSTFTVGMKDDPRYPNDINKSTCGGVLYSACFNSTGQFQDGIKNIFNNTIFSVPWLDSSTTIAQKFKELQKLWGSIANVSIPTEQRKDVFNTLFTNESMTKLYVIQNIGLNTNYYTPFSILAIDPYLAYLAFFMAHVGGGNSFSEYGVSGIFQKAGGGAGTSNASNSWPGYIGKDDTKRAALAVASTEILKAIANWLQKQKQDQKAYYDYWNSLFITDKKCLINMLVLINETVNLQGQTNTFTYQATAATYQNALGEAYKKFEITVAE